MYEHGISYFLLMFEKFTKFFANKAADGAVEGLKESVTGKFDQYGDIFRIGLVLSIIAISGKHIAKHNQPTMPTYSYQPQTYNPRLTSGNGQPIVINNYYPGYIDANGQYQQVTNPYYQNYGRRNNYGNKFYGSQQKGKNHKGY